LSKESLRVLKACCVSSRSAVASKAATSSLCLLTLITNSSVLFQSIYRAVSMEYRTYLYLILLESFTHDIHECHWREVAQEFSENILIQGVSHVLVVVLGVQSCECLFEGSSVGVEAQQGE
jgi:hypothetical protein